MKLSSHIRSISYLKAHISEVVGSIDDQHEPLVITQNGEAVAVLQGVHDYEQQQETMALLKMLALGNSQVEQGKVRALPEAIRSVRQRRR